MQKLAIACALAAQACGHVPILAGTTSALMSGGSGGGGVLCGGPGGEGREPCTDGGGGSDPALTLVALGVVVAGIAGLVTYRLLFAPD
ncbi:MAG: hypothetical protein KIT31_19470 [Deltaproteobacteria bacterium]|nr:hypothetical protein [Deltaproteobacteria bacterium]